MADPTNNIGSTNIPSTNKAGFNPIVLSPQDEEDIKLVGGFYATGFWDNENKLKWLQDSQADRVFHVYGGKKLTDEMLASFTATLDKAFIISLDQEGGPINRLVWAEGVTQISLRALTESKMPREQKYEYAKRIGKLTAKYLKVYGINLNFGPPLDMHTPIKYRNISDNDPSIISYLAKGYMEGIQSENVAYCAKHFPDSATKGDTDIQLVSSNLPIEQLSIEQRYQPLIKAGLPAVMMSHVIFAGNGSPDRTTPASLSREWVNMLRNKMNFDGLIITDAFGKGAIPDYLKSRGLTDKNAVIQAYKAGVDLVMGVYNIASILREAVIARKIPIAQIRKSAQRIRDFSQTFPRSKPLDTEKRKKALVDLEKEAKALYKEITGQEFQDK